MDRWKAEIGRVREEKRREEKKKEDRKVVKHCFPKICRSGGSKSRLAKAAGAEPAGQMRDAKLHAVVARSTWSKCTKHTGSGPLLEVEMSKKCTPLWPKAHLQVKMYKIKQVQTTFGSWDVEKVYAVVARSTFGSQHAKNKGFGPLLDVQMSFRVAGARDCAPCQKWAKHEGFVAFPKTMAGVEDLKRICKHAFSVASAVQDTCSSEMLGGQGADFLREVAFWSIKSSGLLRWFCMTSAGPRMTWHHFFVASALF